MVSEGGRSGTRRRHEGARFGDTVRDLMRQSDGITGENAATLTRPEGARTGFMGDRRCNIGSGRWSVCQTHPLRERKVLTVSPLSERFSTSSFPAFCSAARFGRGGDLNSGFHLPKSDRNSAAATAKSSTGVLSPRSDRMGTRFGDSGTLTH